MPDNLIERVRLTEREISALAPPVIREDEGCQYVTWREPTPKQIADAQLAKALWAVVDWLEGWRYTGGGPSPMWGTGWDLRRAMLGELRTMLTAAGITEMPCILCARSISLTSITQS